MLIPPLQFCSLFFVRREPLYAVGHSHAFAFDPTFSRKEDFRTAACSAWFSGKRMLIHCVTGAIPIATTRPVFQKRYFPL